MSPIHDVEYEELVLFLLFWGHLFLLHLQAGSRIKLKDIASLKDRSLQAKLLFLNFGLVATTFVPFIHHVLLNVGLNEAHGHEENQVHQVVTLHGFDSVDRLKQSHSVKSILY